MILAGLVNGTCLKSSMSQASAVSCHVQYYTGSMCSAYLAGVNNANKNNKHKINKNSDHNMNANNSGDNNGDSNNNDNGFLRFWLKL